MKKTIKCILLIVILATLGYSIYAKWAAPAPRLDTPDEAYQKELEAIKAEPSFISSVNLQAERLHATREQKKIEQKLEDLRRRELDLASSTKGKDAASFLE